MNPTVLATRFGSASGPEWPGTCARTTVGRHETLQRDIGCRGSCQDSSSQRWLSRHETRGHFSQSVLWTIQCPRAQQMRYG
eukprot:4881578-Alexandrium_andersonii.AAC.1